MDGKQPRVPRMQLTSGIEVMLLKGSLIRLTSALDRRSQDRKARKQSTSTSSSGGGPRTFHTVLVHVHPHPLLEPWCTASTATPQQDTLH